MLIPKDHSPELVQVNYRLSKQVTELIDCAQNCHPGDDLWLFWSKAEIKKETLFTDHEKEFCLEAFKQKKYSGPMVWRRSIGKDNYHTHNPVHTCVRERSDGHFGGIH